MIKRLFLTHSHWKMMQAHMQSCAPMEGCGLLAGIDDSVREVFLIPSQLQSPSRFRMDPTEQLRAFRSMEDRGMELIGIFHSHPADTRAGSAPAEEPSVTDIREAAYPAVHVIWSRREGQWSARGFWIENGRISDVPLYITSSE
jgi:proteasome lid subunit RPN8/RPN11